MMTSAQVVKTSVNVTGLATPGRSYFTDLRYDSLVQTIYNNLTVLFFFSHKVDVDVELQSNLVIICYAYHFEFYDHRIIMKLLTTSLCITCCYTLLLALNSVVDTKQALDRFKVPHKVKTEIANHQEDAQRIIDFLTKGAGKHQVYNRLATFVDTFGSRIAGSANLEHAIDYMLDELKSDELDNVHGEEVNVTHWIRGQESAQMIMPRNYSIALLGLGGSVGTPSDGITAEVLVVRSFDELHARASEVICF